MRKWRRQVARRKLKKKKTKKSINTDPMNGANHGKSEDCRKDGAEMCPGCIKETRMNDPDTKTDMPFIWYILKNQRVEGPSYWTDHLSWVGPA